MKNLNLENFGVQEMDAKEMVNVDGGLWGEICAILVGVVVTAMYEGAKADGMEIGKRLKASGQKL